MRRSPAECFRQERSSAGHRQRGADGRREVGADGGLGGQGQEVAAGLLHGGLGAEGAAVAIDGVAAVAEGFEDDAEIVPGGCAGGAVIHSLP